MPLPARTVTAAAIAAGLVVAIGLGATVFFGFGGSDEADAYAQCRRGVVGGAGQIGGPFTLVSETGATVTDKDIITKPSLVYFGYTYCPDVCPIDSTRNAEAAELLGERGYDVQPVFISVDSERDTAEDVREFSDLMSERMVGLTGSTEQIDAATKAYRAYYKVQAPGDPYTLIDHSTQTYLMFPDIGFAEFYNRDTPPEDMAKSVACFMDVWQSGQK